MLPHAIEAGLSDPKSKAGKCLSIFFFAFKVGELFLIWLVPRNIAAILN